MRQLHTKMREIHASELCASDALVDYQPFMRMASEMLNFGSSTFEGFGSKALDLGIRADENDFVQDKFAIVL